MTKIVEVENLTKAFAVERPLFWSLLYPFKKREWFYALQTISFKMDAGEILGVVGPNGAGKTTLLRILADLLLGDSGYVRMEGVKFDGTAYAHRRQIGYVSSDERSFFWRLTGRQNLEFFACLYGLTQKEFQPLLDKTLHEFSLMKKSAQLFRDYSAGTRKKFVLIRALLHRPRLLLLDELTNSLDPPAAQQVKSLVRGYVDQSPRRAAIWSTHRLEEVKEICDRVIIIRDGQIVSIESTKAHQCPNGKSDQTFHAYRKCNAI